MYIMVQNTKHRRNKRNKSVKKQKVRGGGGKSDRSRHESRVSYTSGTSSKFAPMPDNVPTSEIEKKIYQMKTAEYNTRNTAIDKALEMLVLIKDNFTELNNKGSWFNFTFQPEENSFFTPKMSEKYGKYTMSITNRRYILE